MERRGIGRSCPSAEKGEGRKENEKFNLYSSSPTSSSLDLVTKFGKVMKVVKVYLDIVQ